MHLEEYCTENVMEVEHFEKTPFISQNFEQ